MELDLGYLIVSLLFGRSPARVTPEAVRNSPQANPYSDPMRVGGTAKTIEPWMTIGRLTRHQLPNSSARSNPAEACLLGVGCPASRPSSRPTWWLYLARSLPAVIVAESRCSTQASLAMLRRIRP
jgi:hypothetical protein